MHPSVSCRGNRLQHIGKVLSQTARKLRQNRRTETPNMTATCCMGPCVERVEFAGMLRLGPGNWIPGSSSGRPEPSSRPEIRNG